MSSPVDTLPKLVNVLAELREIDPEMPAHTALAFLTVAQSMPDGITQYELGIKLGLSTSAMQRNVKFLSKFRHDLVEVTTPPENGKMRLVRLSAKGKKVVGRLTKIVE